MPELALMFFAGIAVSLITGLLFSMRQLSKYKSKEYQQLQKNLLRIDLRWSDLNAELCGVDAEAEKKELSKAKTTYLLFTVIAMMLSWLGLFLLLIMWVSVKYLIKSRFEKWLFTSRLAYEDVPAFEVVKIFDELGIRYKA